MNGRGDYPDEMRELPLDDAGIEALLRGEPSVADPQLATVAAFVRDMRASTARPAPAPSPALAALLRDGLAASVQPAAPVAAAPRRAPVPVKGWRRRMAVAGIGLSVAVTGVVGAGAAGLLPPPVERVVGDILEAVTPLELPARGSRADERGGDPAPSPDRKGGSSPGASTGRPGADPTVPGATGQGSAPVPPGAAGPGTTTPGAGPPTTRAADGGSGPPLTAPTAPPPSTPGVGPVPTPPTTLPALPPATTPTVPNVTLPGLPTPPTTLPGPAR